MEWMASLVARACSFHAALKSWHERGGLHPRCISSGSSRTTTSSLTFGTLSMNVSATFNVFRLLRDPSLCLPHHTVPNFSHLPVPLSKAFARPDGSNKVDIRAVVLDKDNCFAIPKHNEVHKPYMVSNISLASYIPDLQKPAMFYAAILFRTKS